MGDRWSKWVVGACGGQEKAKHVYVHSTNLEQKKISQTCIQAIVRMFAGERRWWRKRTYLKMDGGGFRRFTTMGCWFLVLSFLGLQDRVLKWMGMVLQQHGNGATSLVAVKDG